MKVIIEISEKLFNSVKEACNDGVCGSDVWEAVAKGVPCNSPKDNLNFSINTIKSLCDSQAGCIDCPMNKNCNEFPTKWEEYNA